MGIVGKWSPVLPRAWDEEVNTSGTVLEKASSPLVVDWDGDFGDESGEELGQPKDAAEDIGDAKGPVFQIGSPLGKIEGDDFGERPFSKFLIRGVFSPGSSSLSTVDWRL